MLSAVLVGSVLLSALPGPSDLAAYETARGNAKQDPDAHVRLAVWCEMHGLDSYKVKHLALAVLINPAHTTARGLLGLMAYRGKWQRPEAVREKVEADEALGAKLAEYNARRSSMQNTADDHGKLAVWCEQNGLKAESIAHFTTVTRLDRRREAAWKHLGYQKHNGQWMTASEIAAEKVVSEVQKKADHLWKPKLEVLRDRLDDRIATRRADAEKSLLEINDPRAVNAIWAVFISERPGRRALAIRMLGQIDDPASSRALALLAAFAPQDDIRRTAREILRNRDPREYVGALLPYVRKPIRYKTDLSRDAEGRIHRVLMIEGEQTNYVYEFAKYWHYTNVSSGLRRIFADEMPFNPMSPILFNAPGGWNNVPVFDTDGAQRLQAMLAGASQANTAAAQHGLTHNQASHTNQMPNPTPAYSAADFLVYNATQVAMARDLQNAEIAMSNAQTGQFVDSDYFQDAMAVIEKHNQFVKNVTSKVYDSLNQITGQDLPPDTEEWQRWWSNVQGYTYTPSSSAQPRKTVYFYSPSCFAKGTMVKTLAGAVPIESLKVGDQVLAQDARTGALSFEVVTVIHHNPPGETLRIRLKDEEILPTIHHRFWRASEGWVKARDLKPGDVIRTLAGLARIEAIESAGTQPVFNLDVSNSHSFFVGKAGALVHDNTLPPLRIEPFDASIRPLASAVATP